METDKPTRKAIRMYRKVIEEEGLSIGDAMNLYKDGASLETVVPSADLLRSNVFKYTGDIQQDYGTSGMVGEEIANPVPPKGDYEKLLKMVPKNLYKPGVMEQSPHYREDLYVRTQLTKRDRDGDGIPDAPPNAADHIKRAFGTGYAATLGRGPLVRPVTKVVVPDKFAFDQAGLEQAAVNNYENAFNALRRPRFFQTGYDPRVASQARRVINRALRMGDQP